MVAVTGTAAGGGQSPATLLRRAAIADQRAFDRAAALDVPALVAVLLRLSRFADAGTLWVVAAGALAATGPAGRRAAARGLASLSLASAVANGPGKLLTRRTRPSLHLVPPLRLLARQPASTSFPSGHAASAAGFATGVALESPALGAAVAPLAAAVAYSRVHTGVHFPGDVAAGVAIGVIAAVAVRRVWPVAPYVR